MAHSTLRPQIDIFCRVIDNFGDAGVLWRLARELKFLGHPVRFIIDDETTLAPLAGFNKSDALTRYQEAFGIEVIHWEKEWDDNPTPLMPSSAVIEGFACQLPHDFEVKMSQMEKAPVWINVDYFSAEDWIEECHMMPSVHPSLGLKKLFYFPGVTPKSGALTIETTYEARRQAFETQHPKSAPLKVLFFGYPYAPLEELANALSQVKVPLRLLLTPTKASETLRDALEKKTCPHIDVVNLPFVDQEHFDELLWASDIAFIRGEDSAARAMIAGVPTIWQIYAQEEDTHLIKLDALVNRERDAFADETLFNTWQKFQRAYNQGCVHAELLNELIEKHDAWSLAAKRWSETLKSNGSLAQKISALTVS